MAEWLRPADCEVLTIKLRGINYQVAHLVSEKRPYSTSRWFQSRPRFYMAPASANIFNMGRMAEWLRLADCEVLTIKLLGINYQVAHLDSKKSPYGTSRWFQSRPQFYMAPASAEMFFGRQDGRVVKASELWGTYDYVAWDQLPGHTSCLRIKTI